MKQTKKVKLNNRKPCRQTPSSPRVSYPYKISRKMFLDRVTRIVPVDMQPLVVSPRAWTWKPCRPGLSPETVPVTVVTPAKKKKQPKNFHHFIRSKTKTEWLQIF